MHVWQLVKDGRGRIYARMYDRGLDRISSATMRVEHLVGKDRLVNDLTRGGHIFYVEAVSYTHLDVYKRQLPSREANGGN